MTGTGQVGRAETALLRLVDERRAVLGQSRRVFVERALEAALAADGPDALPDPERRAVSAVDWLWARGRTVHWHPRPETFIGVAIDVGLAGGPVRFATSGEVWVSSSRGWSVFGPDDGPLGRWVER